jgi:hypothetical protein
MNEAVHLGRKMLGGADHFLRAYGPSLKQLAMGIAPAVARSNPALAAGIASVGQAAGGYSELRPRLGD